MNQKNSIKLNKLCALIMVFFVQTGFAANFNITPFGTLPTTVSAGQTVSAYFTLTNLTSTPRDGYVLQGLPASVTQNTTSPNCSNPINLHPQASCRLQLDISGAVSSNFAICKGSSCTTSSVALNVSQSAAPLVPKFAYVTQGGSGGVQVCIVNSTNGSLSSCIDAGGGLAAIQPQGIVLDSNGTHAFISAGDFVPAAHQCTINPNDGTFSSCSTTDIFGYLPFNGLLTTSSDDSYAYLVDYMARSSNQVLACPIHNGIITPPCTNTGASGLSTDNVGIVLNPTNTVAYLGAVGDPFISICGVSGNGTTFSGCINKGGDGVSIGFVEPTGVALNPEGTILYVADNASQYVYGCNANIDSCFVATTIPSPPLPWSITINKAGTVAYLTDNTSTVYSCPILNDGTFPFGSCIANSGFPQPVSVALKY